MNYLKMKYFAVLDTVISNNLVQFLVFMFFYVDLQLMVNERKDVKGAHGDSQAVSTCITYGLICLSAQHQGKICTSRVCLLDGCIGALFPPVE